ncbi:MAG: chitinase [Streptosporangiaceae bacterium]
MTSPALRSRPILAAAVIVTAAVLGGPLAAGAPAAAAPAADRAAADLTTAGLTTASLTTAAAQADRAGAPGPGSTPTRIPARVYAPYFEAWTRRRITAAARHSGARFFTLAFLQAPRPGSCTLTWNGYRSEPVMPGGRYSKQIAALRAEGGNVIPSFGGYSADQGGTEIADSCPSPARIARAYESVVTDYGVTRLDMDVEARSLTDRAGLVRRDEAIRLLQDWAARRHWPLQIVFTLGVEPHGLPRADLAVLTAARADGVAIAAVNVMAFDYYNKTTVSHMGAEAISALLGVHRQLARLYPGRSSRRLWRMTGITLLPGIDDFPGKTEVTYLPDARRVLRFAAARRLPLISIWAIQRDNGGCPGTIDSNFCSGIRQRPWAFSHLLEPYTGR